MQVFNYKKATQAIFFFLQKAQTELHKVKLLKLLWLADRWHLRNYARTIFDDVYFGMQRGPVASGCKDLLENSDFLSAEEKGYSEQFLSKGKQNSYLMANHTMPDLIVFSGTDLAALELIFSHFGAMAAEELSDFSHQYPEWKKHKPNLASGLRFNMSYDDFFENPNNNHFVFKQSEEKLAVIKEWYLENQMIANLI